MQSRTIEYLPILANRCYSCVFQDGDQVGGVFCEDIKGGRKVKKYGGTELLDELVLGASIMHCLQDTSLGSDNDFMRLSQTMEKFLSVHRNNFLQTNSDSQEILKPNEPNGVASEIAVFVLLSNRSIFPWIESVRMISRISTENSDGVDIVLALAPKTADLLTTNQIYIQVKSDPGAFPKFIKKHENKNHLKEGEGRDHLLKHNFILLNGGAGRVRDIGVIAPFIAQLHQLICLNNSPDAGNQFLQLLGDELRDMLRQPSIIEILERDYSCILNLDFLYPKNSFSM